MRCDASLVRIGGALAFMLVLAGCTAGGQFDPAEVFSADIFGTKKKLQGDREPVFPNGVPGADTGVPPDLVKGYQPPPEQAADNTQVAPAPAAAEAKPKPKSKPRPKVARAPAPPPQQQSQQTSQRPHDPVWDRVPTSPAQQTAQPGQSAWPTPQQPAPAQQTAQPAQSVWPNPAAPGTYSR